MNEDSSKSLVSSGITLLIGKKYKDAERAFRRAIELDPENLLAHVNLGYILYLQNKHKDAKKIYDLVDLKQSKQEKYPYPLVYSYTGNSYNKNKQDATDIFIAKVLYDNYHIAESIETLRHSYRRSDNPEKILDAIKELSLDVYGLERILGNRHPYVIERQKELSGDKLDRVKGKLKDALEEVASIPFPERKEIIRKLLDDLEPLRGEVPPPLPTPDLSGNTYPLYVKRTDPFKHLEEVWGPWLVRYTPSLKHDYLDQKQLRERDPVLFTALSNRLKRIKEQVRDYIPPYRTPFHP